MNSYQELADSAARHNTSIRILTESQNQSKTLFVYLATYLKDEHPFPLFHLLAEGDQHVYISIGVVKLLVRSEISIKKGHSQNLIKVYEVREKPKPTATPTPVSGTFDGIGNFTLNGFPYLYKDFCAQLLRSLTDLYIDDKSISFYSESHLPAQ